MQHSQILVDAHWKLMADSETYMEELKTKNEKKVLMKNFLKWKRDSRDSKVLVKKI